MGLLWYFHTCVIILYSYLSICPTTLLITNLICCSLFPPQIVLPSVFISPPHILKAPLSPNSTILVNQAFTTWAFRGQLGPKL